MKYKGEEKQLLNFFESKGMKITLNKGTIDLCAENNSGTIVNWYKKSGTLYIQGTKNEQFSVDLENFINGAENENFKTLSHNIYIVHGHDLDAKEQLENILLKWDLKPIATMDQPSSGGTIIETLIRDLESCDYGIVLLTPDDEGNSKKDGPESRRPRARQNVILELGILLGTLGRKNVMVVRKSDIEEPSDIHGILYKAYSEKVSEIKDHLRKEFKAVGIQIKE
ncbi:nucleotide-binding protein [Spiroplasma endosymbiont of Cantharis nigra]|uniref:nucleotide-binding protein n=1 Tax=Spiroplasma endosymbiont of Cantharis nigra TaxID=3066278 RepID=UPI0030CAA1EA